MQSKNYTHYCKKVFIKIQQQFPPRRNFETTYVFSKITSLTIPHSRGEVGSSNRLIRKSWTAVTHLPAIQFIILMIIFVYGGRVYTVHADNVGDLCVAGRHKFRSFKKGRRFRWSHDKLLMILWTGNRDGYRELASQKGRVVQHDTAKTFEYLFALCSNWKKWPRFSSGHGPSESMEDRTRPLSCLLAPSLILRHTEFHFERKSSLYRMRPSIGG